MSIDRRQGDNVWLTVGLREGKNREVKTILAHLGLDVNRLIRVSFGPFQLGELADGKPVFFLEVSVPVMTVCPCSKAISDEGAHSQRALVRLCLDMTGFAWIEEFVELAERAGSSPVYPLLKREDEKFVTERSFANPRFVEDSVRELAIAMENDHRITWYSVSVTSHESIHNHDAFASVERSKI